MLSHAGSAEQARQNIRLRRAFNEFAKALEKRATLLKRFGFRDTHPPLAKLTH